MVIEDEFDDIIDDETSDDDELDQLINDGIDDDTGSDDGVDYKDKYLKTEKSRRHQQKYVSKLQKKVDDMEKKMKEQGKSAEERNQKLAVALGVKDPSDEQAKKIVEEFNEDPTGYINRTIEAKLNEKLPDLNSKIERTSMKADVQDIMDDLESEYEVEFTPQFASKVSKILEGFDKKFRIENRKKAILQATRLAMDDKPLKKRADAGFFVENGKITGFKGSPKDKAEAIKERIAKAGGSKDIFK